jgi:hypothetical protein
MVIGGYIPPSDSFDDDLSHLTSILTQHSLSDTRTILVGDINAHLKVQCRLRAVLRGPQALTFTSLQFIRALF